MKFTCNPKNSGGAAAGQAACERHRAKAASALEGARPGRERCEHGDLCPAQAGESYEEIMQSMGRRPRWPRALNRELADYAYRKAPGVLLFSPWRFWPGCGRGCALSGWALSAREGAPAGSSAGPRPSHFCGGASGGVASRIGGRAAGGRAGRLVYAEALQAKEKVKSAGPQSFCGPGALRLGGCGRFI